ncbi:MAG: VOC family protein [Frankiales bacterium]|nr:VOC family protein [Frankiales bacterium]
MSLRLAHVVIDAVDPDGVARFWCAALDWAELEREDGVICLGPADGGPGIDVCPVPEVKTDKNRLHLDLRADEASTGAELERLLGLGARLTDVGQPTDATWMVLADPEGNEFCLLGRTVQQV